MSGRALAWWHVICHKCARVIGRFSSGLGGSDGAERRARELAISHGHGAVVVKVQEEAKS
jgi:hypothetical protein